MGGSSFSPSLFVSYSHDDQRHRSWVKKLAKKLRGDGIRVTLDQWELVPGDQLPEFMEKSIRECNYVLVICTPNYKKRSDERLGGVGYEGDIITGELAQKENHRKFIPLLRVGEWENSSPTWVMGKKYLDFSGRGILKKPYRELLDTLLDVRETPPPVGGNWDLEAEKAARIIVKHFIEAHRGAIMWTKNVVALFGNRTDDEIPVLRKKFAELSVKEIGFGRVSRDSTWVILVEADESDFLNELVWECCSRQNPVYIDIEREIANNFLWPFYHTPYTQDDV